MSQQCPGKPLVELGRGIALFIHQKGKIEHLRFSKIPLSFKNSDTFSLLLLPRKANTDQNSAADKALQSFLFKLI